MRPACMIHVVWHHFILVPSTSFSQVPWSVLWLCHQFVTDVTAWLINPNPSCSKNRKRKEKKTKNKIQEKEKIKTESTVNDLDSFLQFEYEDYVRKSYWLHQFLLNEKEVEKRVYYWQFQRKTFEVLNVSVVDWESTAIDDFSAMGFVHQLLAVGLLEVSRMLSYQESFWGGVSQEGEGK